MSDEILTDEEKIVLGIANNPDYRNPNNGRIKWALAIGEHPECQDMLQYAGKGHGRGEYILDNLKKRGVVAPPGLTEPEKWVLKIVTECTKENGLVDWQAGYAKYPEAKLMLSYGDKDPKGQKGMNIATALRKKGLLPENNMSKAAKRGRKATPKEKKKPRLQIAHAPNGIHHAPTVSEQVMARVEAIIRDCALCPRCGRDLEKLLRLSAMEDKFQSLPVDSTVLH